METYLVIIGRTRTGYSAHCPDVPGCAAVGTTVEKVVSNMRKALEFHFEGMLEDKESIPRPRGIASYRQAMKDLHADQYLLAHVQMDISRLMSARRKHSTTTNARRRPPQLATASR